MQIMESIKNLVKTELERIDGELFSISINQNDLGYDLNNFLKSPRKRIRSLVAILYLKAFSQNIDEQIINILTAGELIHNASILHDDVIDDAETRRGNITIGKKFAPEISILTGDFLLSIAIEKIMALKNWDIVEINQK